MNCFHSGVTADERWKNELLNEMRQIRQLLEKVTGAESGQLVDIEEAKPKRKPRKAVSGGGSAG